jgi:hypothetical protein
MLFDLLQASGLLQEHVRTGRVIFGVNLELTDWVNNKPKTLDLVVARPAPSPKSGARTFADLVDEYSILLDDSERRRLDSLPTFHEGATGAVLLATEAKACMTEHGKAGPRLYDELNSSHTTVHGASNQALAVGLAMINCSEQFVSPIRNPDPTEPDPDFNEHKQPRAAQSAIERVMKLARRSSSSQVGFDGLGIFLVALANDGSPVRRVTEPPAPHASDPYNYEAMITRIAGEYDATFRHV